MIQRKERVQAEGTAKPLKDFWGENRNRQNHTLPISNPSVWSRQEENESEKKQEKKKRWSGMYKNKSEMQPQSQGTRAFPGGT